ncbi:MAG: hypothetical protein H6Q05_595 [Acidobacteria bacterium]|nr:hypothetical protein [Acidobacteriota bacterium]
MKKQTLFMSLLGVVLAAFIGAFPAMAAGDKLLVQAVDGAQPDGIRYRTKFDFINLSPFPESKITRVSVNFFLGNGTPWTVATNRGTFSSVTLNLGYSQTLRIETLGQGSLVQGYVIVRNLETTTSYYADDFEVGITAYYEVSLGSDVLDTVSIPISEPTLAFVFPVEIDPSKGTNTGFGIVNLTDAANNVTLYLSEAVEPSSNNAIDRGSAIVALDASTNKKRVGFMGGFFPNLTSFKGMVYGTSQGPVAVLALLQSQAKIGVQFSTLTATRLDAMRRNNLLFLLQGYSLDADLPVADYFRDESNTDAYYETPWDLLFETVGDVSAGQRRLTPQQGAAFSPIGVISNSDDFDNITIEALRARTYNFNSIDLSNGSANLNGGFAFAIRTALGQYAKVRIRTVIAYDSDPRKDIAIEVYVYK